MRVIMQAHSSLASRVRRKEVLRSWRVRMYWSSRSHVRIQTDQQPPTSNMTWQITTTKAAPIMRDLTPVNNRSWYGRWCRAKITKMSQETYILQLSKIAKHKQTTSRGKFALFSVLIYYSFWLRYFFSPQKETSVAAGGISNSASKAR